MQNMKKIILYILVLASSFGCDDFLDVKPKGKLIPDSVEDFDHLLDNSGIVEWNFLDNNRGSLLPFLTDDIELTEAQADAYSNHVNIDRFNAFRFDKPYKSSNKPDQIWNGSYKKLAYVNTIIEGIRDLDVPESDVISGKRVVAQALIARAWIYFNLVNIYGPVYHTNNNETRVLPYVISGDIGQDIPRLSSVNEIYTHVKKDVFSAIHDLPNQSKHPFRANKKAAYALLTDIHLVSNRWDSVVYYANKAWAGEERIYDYNEFYFQDEQNPNKTNVLGYDQTARNKENLFHRNSASSVASGSSNVSKELYALFENNDLRAKFFYDVTEEQDGSTSIKQTFTEAQFVFTTAYSYPEVLLMRAEGYARLNQLQKAIDDLNLLRKYRYETGVEDLALGNRLQDEVIKLVLDERRRELAFRTTKRFVDLKRLSLDVGKSWHKAKLIHQVGNDVYEGNISEHFFLNLPQEIIDYHPEWEL